MPDTEGSAPGPGSRKNLQEGLWGSASLAREWIVRSGQWQQITCLRYLEKRRGMGTKEERSVKKGVCSRWEN